MKKLLLLTLLVPALSNAMVVYDPTNWIENSITATNSVTSLTNQAVMLKSQADEMQRNWDHLGSYKYQELASVLHQLDSVTQQGQSLSYSSNNMDQRFNQYYPNYANQNTANYQNASGQWNETTLNTLHNSLSAAAVTADQVSTENALMQQLKSQSEGATGNMQAMQVSNEISMESVQQLQLMKRLIATQQNSQTAYMASQVSRESYQDKVMSDVATTMPAQYPSYHENAAFGLITP